MADYITNTDGNRILVKVYPDDIVNGKFEVPGDVTIIKWGAFYGCTSLTSVVIPDSVTTIGANAFSNCTSLTSVVIPDSVTTIGDFAFSGCTNLTSVVISDRVMTIWWGAFSGCTSLTSVVIPNSVATIELSAFSGCTSLTSVVIPDSVAAIWPNAFSNCTSLTSVVIPNSVTEIGALVFNGCANLEVIAINAVGDEFERIKGLLPAGVQSKVISVDDYNTIKAVQAEVCQRPWAEKLTVQGGESYLPGDLLRLVGGYSYQGPTPEMQQAINTVPLPNRKEEGWRENYSKRLREVLSQTDFLAVPVPVPVTPETRETNRQSSSAVASQAGFWSSEAPETEPEKTPDSELAHELLAANWQ